MEEKILKAIKTAISSAIENELSGYNSPLKPIIKNVVDDNQDSLYALINDEFSSLLNDGDFKSSLKKALNDKLAKVLVGRMGGELEKRINELKSNPTTRAKITLAIESAVSEL